MPAWIFEYLGGPAIVILFGAILSAVGGYWSPLNNSKWPRRIIFIGVIVCAIGAFWASIEQSKSERKITEKSEEIARLNEKITHSITGGDSFGYLLFELFNIKNNTAKLIIIQEGDYPLYDVKLRIVDINKYESLMKQLGKSNFNALLKSETNISIGNLAPHSSEFLKGTWNLPDSGGANYNIFITARNGFFTELARLKRIKGKWKAAYKIKKSRIKNGVNETLLEKIDPDFPRNKQGEVEWEVNQ